MLFSNRKSIIVGDLNAKSKLWGSPQTEERGLLLEEKIEENGAVVVYSGQPTYQHYSGSQSHLDVAIVTSDLGARTNWAVHNNTLGSDHCPTVVTIDELDTGNFAANECDHLTLNLSKADWRVFKRVCNESFSTENETVMLDDGIDVMYNTVVKLITQAVEKCIPQLRRGGPRRYNKKKHERVPYWDDNCRNAIYSRNRERNKMNKKRTPENVTEYH